MKISREWATPLTMGAFTLMAITGVLMFFHLDSELQKTAHEWLGWLFLVGVASHSIANWQAVTRHLSARLGQGIVAVFVAVVGLSFVPLGGDEDGDGPPWKAVVQTLAQAPMVDVAHVAKVDEATVRARLQRAGVQGAQQAPTIAAATGPDLGQQMRALKAALAEK
jgi:hypothetical protein